MTLKTEMLVVEEGKKERLDAYLAENFPHYSRSYFQRLIRTGNVKRNDKSCVSSHKVCLGDVIRVTFIDEREILKPDASVVFDIIHEDDAIIVLNKPAGLVVHPACGNFHGTLAHGLAAHNSFVSKQIVDTFDDKMRPGIVHRLDKNTSGVMVVAKTLQAHAFLSKQFIQRMVHKTYRAIVQGIPQDREAIIDMPIGRDPSNRQKMTVITAGREAQTRFVVKETRNKFSLIEVIPLTGRTHQIRVHLSAIGCPVVGDTLYHGPAHIFDDGIEISRQMLHAWKLVFVHPLTQKKVEYTAHVPTDFLSLWKKIEGN